MNKNAEPTAENPARRQAYRVWLEQINASVIDVKAINKHEAVEKARRIWRRDYGHPSLGDVQLDTVAEGTWNPK